MPRILSSNLANALELATLAVRRHLPFPMSSRVSDARISFIADPSVSPRQIDLVASAYSGNLNSNVTGTRGS